MNDFRSEGLKAIHEFLGELEGEVNNTKEKAGEVSHYLGMYLNDVEKAIGKAREYVEGEYGQAVLRDKD